MDAAKFRDLWVVALLVASPLLLMNVQAQAQLSELPTPAYITFDDDVPGSRPATGGINQPTFLRREFASILVRESVLGIDTQPVHLFLGGVEPTASVRIDFAPKSSGIVRVEATISLDLAPETSASLLSAGGSPLGGRRLASISAFGGLPTGELVADGETIGSFENNKPFRVRFDIDLGAETWSAVLDEELNGFGDDNVVSDLQFGPSSFGIFDQVNAFLKCNCLISDQTFRADVAYDDISVSVNGITVVPLDVTGKSINVCNKSPIKAAALGRPFFDTTDIEPETMMLADASIRTVGKKEKLQAKVKDTDRDGNPDLEGKFVSQDLGLSSDDEFAILQAQTFGSEPVEGLDAVSVREVMCSRSAESALLGQE